MARLGAASGAFLASQGDQWVELAQVAGTVVVADQVPVLVTYVGQFPRPYSWFPFCSNGATEGVS